MYIEPFPRRLRECGLFPIASGPIKLYFCIPVKSTLESQLNGSAGSMGDWYGQTRGVFNEQPERFG